MNKRSIFIAATGQNVGKTTICLGIVSGLKKRFRDVGFIKPVGQQHVEVGQGLKVDKDAVLFKEHFNLTTDYSDLSPVMIPAGFTRQYLSGEIGHDHLRKRILDGFATVAGQSDFTVVEGTGHVGVGSIIDLNNAKIAADLDVEIVLIASGGLGSTIDDLALNIEVCRHYGVNIRGVILNRVLDDKRAMILEFIPKALAKFGIPLLGCIPFSRFLSTHSMEDFEILFNTRLLAGDAYRYFHFRTTRLVAGSLASYLAEDTPNELIITPASRDDIIHSILDRYPKAADQEGHLLAGVLLTGRQPPSTETLQRIQKGEIPFLYVPMCSYDAMKKITSLVSKIRNEDVRKVQKAIDIVESNIDFSLLCKNIDFSQSNR